MGSAGQLSVYIPKRGLLRMKCIAFVWVKRSPHKEVSPTCLGVVSLFLPGNCFPHPTDWGSVLTRTGSLSSPRHSWYSHSLNEGEEEGEG